MKKFTFFLCALAILSCIFAISIFADEAVTDTFYVVSSQDSEVAVNLKAQGKDVVVLSEIYASTKKDATGTWLDNFAAGSHVELIFAENIVESINGDWGIVLNKKITLTVRYNGFSHYVTNNGRSNAFVLRHADATIRFIGTHAIDGENGQISHSFNANSANPDSGNLDIYHGKVYCWIYDGDAYAYNMRTKTGEEFIFTAADDDTSNSKINTITVHSCAVSCIGIAGDGDMKTIDFKDSYIARSDFESLCTGSVIDNCVFDNNYFYMDSHGITNQMLVIKNCTLDSVKTDTGRTHLTLIDCKINFAKFTLGSDGGGAGYALVYTSTTCENDGSLNVYKNGKGATPVNDDSRYADVVTEYYANPQNKALGHNFEWKHNYDGEKYLSGLNAAYRCTRCDLVEQQVFIGALFNTLGFSVPQFGGELSITVGYAINKNAIAEYESLTGNKISFGCAIAVKDCIGEGVAPLDENGNAIVLSRGRVVVADATNEPNSYMDVKINLTSDHIDTQLLITGYIAEMCGDSLSISYMQSNNMLVEENQFSYVSYNNH